MALFYHNSLRSEASRKRFQMIKSLRRSMHFVFEHPRLVNKLSKLSFSLIKSYYDEYIVNQKSKIK